jgi:hypothetical protein
MSKNIWDMSLKEASTRPEFYQFMTVGLKDLLFDAYKKAATTYDQLVTKTTSVKDKEGYASLGNVSLPDQVLEGEPFPEKSPPKQDLVEITNIKFGEIIAITRELIDDEQTGRIKQMPSDLGNAHAKKEDKSVYSVIVANATCYDAQALFSLNHPGYTGGAAIASNDNLYTAVTLTANAIAVAIGMVALWTGHTSEDILDVAPKALLVPKRLRYAAHVLTQTQFLPMAYAAGVFGPAAAAGNTSVNPIKEQALGIISSARLDTSTSGTALTDWYVWTDFPGLIFQWRNALELMAEGEAGYPNFERDVYRWKSRARWGVKPINWRCGMLVS